MCRGPCCGGAEGLEQALDMVEKRPGAGLAPAALREAEMRKEDGKPVRAYLFAFRRP